MKNYGFNVKKFFPILTIILAGLFCLPAFCFAAITYSRTPAGLTPENPIIINFSFDDWETDLQPLIGCPNVGEEDINLCQFWIAVCDNTGIHCNNQSGSVATYTPFYSTSTKNISYSFDLPAGDYTAMGINSGYDNVPDGGDYLEGDEEGIIFTISAETPAGPGQILNIDPSGPANILAFSGRLFTDTQQLIFLAIGLPVGFWIIYKLIGMFQADWKKDDELIEKVKRARKNLKY